MADLPPYPETDSAGTPRWVKVLGIIAIVVGLLFIVLQFMGGGNHGPSRHMPSGNAPVEGGR